MRRPPRVHLMKLDWHEQVLIGILRDLPRADFNRISTEVFILGDRRAVSEVARRFRDQFARAEDVPPALPANVIPFPGVRAERPG